MNFSLNSVLAILIASTVICISMPACALRTRVLAFNALWVVLTPVEPVLMDALKEIAVFIVLEIAYIIIHYEFLEKPE